jgi:3-hydroxy-9,10-secoandrosta-1,3,5(10)-triene-9,17-dione monooxygenase reductase component
MGHLPTGVTVVSTHAADGSPLATTVNAMTCVSLEPPIVLVCLAHDSDTLAGIHERRVFGVSILAEDQRAISSRFACKGGAAKSTGLDLIGSANAVPMLAGALAHLHCRVDRVLEAGDHEIVLGEVVDLRVARPDGRPLIRFRGQYTALDTEQ